MQPGPTAPPLGTAAIFFVLAYTCLQQPALAALDFNADYRLDNASIAACFNSTISACACMNTRPAPLGSPDQRRIITAVDCWDCQAKMCMQRTCRRTFTMPYCDLYVGCVRLCLCRCPGTRYGQTGRSFVYIPCNQWCDGTPDCPYGLDEPKGVYCAKRNYWFTIMPLSTIGLVVLFLLTCRKSIVKTIHGFSRRSMGQDMFLHVPEQDHMSHRVCRLDGDSSSPHAATGMQMQPLHELPPYSYDGPPGAPIPQSPIEDLSPPPSYESVISADEEERARLNKP